MPTRTTEDCNSMTPEEKKKQRQEEALLLELGDVDTDVCSRMKNIIAAKWDAPSLMREVESFINQREKILEELYVIEDYANHN